MFQYAVSTCYIARSGYIGHLETNSTDICYGWIHRKYHLKSNLLDDIDVVCFRRKLIGLRIHVARTVCSEFNICSVWTSNLEPCFSFLSGVFCYQDFNSKRRADQHIVLELSGDLFAQVPDEVRQVCLSFQSDTEIDITRDWFSNDVVLDLETRRGDTANGVVDLNVHVGWIISDLIPSSPAYLLTVP